MFLSPFLLQGWGTLAGRWVSQELCHEHCGPWYPSGSKLEAKGIHPKIMLYAGIWKQSPGFPLVVVLTRVLHL